MKRLIHNTVAGILEEHCGSSQSEVNAEVEFGEKSKPMPSLLLVWLLLLSFIFSPLEADTVFGEDDIKNLVLPAVQCHASLCHLQQGCE